MWITQCIGILEGIVYLKFDDLKKKITFQRNLTEELDQKKMDICSIIGHCAQIVSYLNYLVRYNQYCETEIYRSHTVWFISMVPAQIAFK